MTRSRMQVLSETVRLYDERGEPITPTDLAATTELAPSTVRAYFDGFESKHLLKRAGDGYRPTVTARELLELDVADDVTLILDVETDE